MNRNELRRRVEAFPRAVFDLDGTLFDPSDYETGAFEDVADLLRRLSGASKERIYGRLLERRRLDPQSRTIIDDVVRDFKLDPAIAAKAVDIFRCHDGRYLTPKNSLLADLLAIADKGVRLALVTNGRTTVQMVKIRRLELEKVFDCLVICDPVRPAQLKPMPWAWEKLKDWRAGQATVMVGDSDIDQAFARTGKAEYLPYRFLRDAE